jgi:hypothetical protein
MFSKSFEPSSTSTADARQHVRQAGVGAPVHRRQHPTVHVEAGDLPHHLARRHVRRHVRGVENSSHALIARRREQERPRRELRGDQSGHHQLALGDEVLLASAVAAVAKAQVVGNARVVGGLDLDRHARDCTGGPDSSGLRTRVRRAKMAT